MRILIAFLRVTFGVVLALVLVELGFRLLPGKEPVRWSDRPKEYYIPENAQTLQDGFYPDIKPPGTFRIVVVGDSFTFGPHVQYDDTFSKRLERWFNLNNLPDRVEVINAGVSGYSTKHEVQLVKKAIEVQQADLVILEITLNDAELGPLTAEKQKEPYGAPYLKKPLFKYWKSARYFLERLHNSKTHRLYKKYFFDLYDNPQTFPVFADALRQIGELSEKTKIPVRAVIFPLFSYPMDQSYPFLSIHEKIHSELHSANLPYLDLLHFYDGIPNEHLHVIPVEDSHPNEIGHRIAAEEIYRWLRENKAVPDEFFAKRIYARRKDMLDKSIRKSKKSKQDVE